MAHPAIVILTGRDTSDEAIRRAYDRASFVFMTAAAYAAEDAAAVAKGLHFALYDELARQLRPQLESDPGELYDLNYLALRGICRKLRSSLEEDPKRRDWKRDFRPR